MANVFLSYDREDFAKAKSVAALIEDAGHQVWWDRHIRGGAQYTKEIERALDDSDSVVVLWSAASVDSEWVRDEAAEGRDRGKLIPVMLDPVKPPMGFRQFQTIDLSGPLGGKSAAQEQQLLDALDIGPGISSVARPTADPVPPPRIRKSGPERRTIFIGLGLALALIAGLAAWYFSGNASKAQTVAVAAGDSSPTSQSMARNLLVKLGVLQGADAAAIQIIDASDTSRKADLQFKISGNEDGGVPRANVALVSTADGAILWSKDYDANGGARADLEEQIGFSAARVLACAADEANYSGQLSDKSRRLYLNACASLAEAGWDKRSVLTPLRQVLDDSPDFGPAWAKLLIAEADVISLLQSGDEPNEAMVVQLRKDIAAARKVDPDLAEATIAEAGIAPQRPLASLVDRYEKAKSQDPGNPLALSALGQIFQSVGLMHDGVAEAKQAAEIDPLSPVARNSYILALDYAGQYSDARAELEKAKKLWPGSQSVTDAQFALDLRSDKFAEALGSGADQGFAASQKAYITARQNPTDVNVANFLTVFDSDRGSAQLSFAVQALGEMKRPDDFYRLIDQTGPELLANTTYVLFRPWVDPIRRDPRFMGLAKKLGLVDYWRSSGKWPDFCLDRSLPYDCKAEAAKLG